jgi:CHAT domain-containing protein
VALLIAAGLVAWLWPPVFSRARRHALRGATPGRSAALVRSIEGRLCGFAYAPFDPAAPWPAIRRLVTIAQRIELRRGGAAAPPPTAGPLADLLAGHPRAAADELEKLGKGSGANACVWSDLAAARLAAARLHGEPYDHLLALAAAERALAIAPSLMEARFNRALALTCLHLDRHAGAAWSDYRRGDPGSGWAREASAYLAAATAPDDNLVWARERPRLEAAATRGDRAATAEIVRRLRLRARRFGEEELLGRWAELQREGETARAGEAMGAARTIGAVLAESGGDRMLADATAAVERALRHPAGSALADLVNGHLAYRAGVAAYDRDDLHAAAAALARARRALARTGSPLAWSATLFLAAVDYQNQANEAALAKLREIGRRCPPSRYPSVAARALWITGLIHGGRARLEAAIASFDAALALYERTGQRDEAAAIHHLLAEAFYTIGDRQETWRHLDPALREIRSLSEPKRQEAILAGAALAAADAGEPLIALLYQDQAVSIAREGGHPAAIAELLRVRALLEHRAGQGAAAATDLAAARAAAGGIESGARRQASLAEIDLAVGEISRHRDPRQAVASLTPAIGNFLRTGYHLKLAEAYLARARAYRELTDHRRAGADLQAGLVEVERERRHIGESQRVSFLDQARPLVDEIVSLELDHLADPAGAYVHAEETRAQLLQDRLRARFGTGNLGARLGLREIGDRLPPGSVLLEYSCLETRVLIWAAWRGGSAFATGALGADELARLVERFREAILGRQDGEVRRLGGRLDAALLGPIRARLPAFSRLVVVPHKSLFALPFAALVDGSTGRYLVERACIEIAPSARAYLRCAARLRERPSPAPPRVLLVGDPSFDRRLAPHLRRLAGAAAEVAAIAKLYLHATVLSEASASKPALLAAAADAEIVHLATHARVNRRLPLLSDLVLAPDPRSGDAGILRAGELYALRFPTVRLVVLGACETASGPISASEGVLSLASPFLAAGVPTVVATLWAVDDSEASQLALAFHRRLAAGASPGAALREAQLSLLRGPVPALRDPAAWAGAELIGAGDAAPDDAGGNRPRS